MFRTRLTAFSLRHAELCACLALTWLVGRALLPDVLLSGGSAVALVVASVALGVGAPLADRRPMDISRIENIHTRSYNDARRIGEHYRDGVPVIMNLTELDDTDAKRIIDFAAGLVFGLRGSIERITNKVFLLSPPNVDVGDQARAQVAEDGFFNQS